MLDVLLVGSGVFILVLMFILKKTKFNSEISRFILAGGLNTINYYLMYLILFEFFKLVYVYAHITAFMYSAFCSFFITTLYTFSERVTFKKAVLFPITFLPNFLISTLGTVIIVNNNMLSERYASLIAMFIAVPITFLLSKFIVGGNIKMKPQNKLTEDW